MFSLVVKIASLRIMITLVATHNLHIHQMDAKITFLNGSLNEKNYITQFERFNCSSKSPKEVNRLFKTLWEEKGVLQLALQLGFWVAMTTYNS
jgi:hypothetical protein